MSLNRTFAFVPLVLFSAAVFGERSLPGPDPLASSSESQKPTIDLKIEKPSVGDNNVSITISGLDEASLAKAKVFVTSAMTSMDMGSNRYEAKAIGKGAFEAKVPLSMAGQWRLSVDLEIPGRPKVSKPFLIDAAANGMSGMKMDAMGSMGGRLGDWGMQREGSGTSWLPESSPMFMKALPSEGRYDFNLMGSFSLNYSSTNGPRGDSRFFSNSMPMLMIQNKTGGGILGIDLMASLDPIFNGETGYPDLFQTGETAYGNPLVDHQHPHNLLSEVAASYSHPIGGDFNAFVYGGPIAEPALGGPMFMHRPSGMEIPEAPISHHWFDSTHISSGVVTLGVNNHLFQVEGSVFNGHEPGENRYWPQPIQFNSYSGRVTVNPTRDLSLSASYGYLESPEADAPGVNQDRATLSAIFSVPFKSGDNLSTTAYWGRVSQAGDPTDAYVVESTYYHRGTSIFARWENVAKNELVGIPTGDYRINKILFGGVQNFASSGGFDFGVGAYGGLYSYPGSLDPYYGHSPVTLGIFFRIRPSRMPGDMPMGKGKSSNGDMPMKMGGD